MMLKRILIKLLILSLLLIMTGGCDKSSRQLVIYTSVDRVYSEPIFQAFTKETGIQVLPVYDVEATKTTGIVQRLMAEKKNPQADVFWNGEILYTMKLKDEGILAPYEPKNTDQFPEQFVDEDHMWIAFGGRARVFVLRPDLVKAAKEAVDNKKVSLSDPISLLSQGNISVLDIADLSNDYKIGIAKPMFGTSASHAAALYAILGQEVGRDTFDAIRQSQTYIVDGNAAARDMVVSGQLDIALTDTDDALGAIRKGEDLQLIFPDQGVDQLGTLLIPNTIAMIKGGKNPEEAKVFIDYILKEENLRKMIDMGWFQLSFGDQVLIDDDLKAFVNEEEGLKLMDISYPKIRQWLDISSQDMNEFFLN